MTVRQFRGTWHSRYGKAALIGLAVGIVLELEQTATRTGNCDLQDLVPDAMGIVLGMLVMVMWDAAARAVRGERTPDSRSTGG